MDIKERFTQELEKVWGNDSKMVDYCVKESAVLVELEDGNIYSIEKPRIETHFCFGYGLNGVTTQEDMERAYNCESHARNDGDYFKQENLAPINQRISVLRDKDYKVYKGQRYISGGDKIVGLEFCKAWESPSARFVELNDNEREKLIEAYEQVKVSFEKRLNTYLKRYGTSKLRTWTYLVD